MVKIEWDTKLGFRDVLFRPKRSQMKSRKDVNIHRTYQFLHSKQTWTGIPVIAANMDTTGTFEMAIAFAKHDCMVAIHKHYTLQEWIKFGKNNESILSKCVAVSAGTSENDFKKVCEVWDNIIYYNISEIYYLIYTILTIY